MEVEAPTEAAPSRAQRDRSEIIPNANDPRRLVRLITLVARGFRRPRALAELMDVQVRTVHYYTQAGEWLGLLSARGEVHLTALGLSLAFAEPSQRWRIYAQAILAQPLAASILAQAGAMPDTKTIAALILAQEPEMADITARRRASALRGLLAPAVGKRPARTRPGGVQLALPLTPSSPLALPAQGARLDLRAGEDDNPDVYAFLLRVLLDEGELSLGQIRATLDAAGGHDCPLGTYTEWATRRGDATRIDDRLVISAGAIRRRTLATDGTLIALSEPGYRAWLSLLQHADPQDPHDRREIEQLRKRYTRWDQRIFRHALAAEGLTAALQAALPGRNIDGLPLAGHLGPALTPGDRPFIDSLDQRGLVLSLPRSLAQLTPQVQGINGALKLTREAPAGVRLPTPASPRRAVHGGLLYPSEAPPRAIPDTFSLRLRLLSNTPAFTLLAAALLLGRRAEAPVSIRPSARGPAIWFGRRAVAPLVEALTRFAEAQGWTTSQPEDGALGGALLAELATRLGIATRVGRRLLLDEQLFVLLQSDPEAQLIYEALVPLSDRLLAWLEGDEPSP